MNFHQIWQWRVLPQTACSNFLLKWDGIKKTMYSKCNQILSRTCEVPGSNLFPEIGYYKLKLSAALLSTSKQVPDTTPTSNTAASFQSIISSSLINRLTPNDPHMGRTAPLTSKHCILYIYSTNVGTEYFKHALHSPFFIFKMQFVS